MPYRYILICIAVAILSSEASASPLDKVAEEFRSRFGAATVASVRRIKTGEELVSIRSDSPVIPASCTKLFTTYAALRSLGGEYNFKTELFLSPGGSPVLSVRGRGDPTMTEERAWKIADDLYRAGIRKISGLVLDDSLFIEQRKRTGLNPYEAAQSALPMNFNTVNVRAQLFGGEIVISTSSFVSESVRSQMKVGDSSSITLVENNDGDIVVRGAVLKDGSAIEDNITVKDPTKLFGEIFTGVLRKRGIQLTGGVTIGKVSPALAPFLISKSKDLSQILVDLNRYSSNFIAGQIVYAMGESEEGKFSFQRGLDEIRKNAKEAGVDVLNIADGSGLSRETRTTAASLTKIIAAAANDPGVAPDYFATLPRFGRRGTLRRRSLGLPGEEAVWGKTGYLEGVSCLAGTIPLAQGELAAYAVITNGKLSKNEANEREENFIQSILRALRSPSFSFGSR